MLKLFAANWKMHKTAGEGRRTAAELVRLVAGKLPADREVLILPPFTALDAVRGALAGASRFNLGAQNFYPQEQGAFTGEISPGMLREAGAAYLLAGHSERRHVFGESDAFVGEKAAFGLKAGFSLILCVGETIEERRAGRLEEILSRQLEAGVADVPRDLRPERLSIAYEPVWAIGTGEVPGPREIEEAHGLIRSGLKKIFGGTAAEMRLLYGGSVKPKNASEIIGLDNVDGVLVGGASLTADDFSRIVLA